MKTVEIMDEVLANKIAAGEVIEKLMNVVKELVENSIDASSDVIKVELIDSGVKEIKVTDNGIGMSKEDASLAFFRHATSKLKTLDDLFNIDSLGFRGEALPSIASVSHVELKTSTKEEGTLVTITSGKDQVVKRSDLSKGTVITVKNLFYNTPVRLKYLKSLYAELALITDYMNKMALSMPNIKFTLINNGKTILDTSGNGDLLKVIYDIYGSEVAKKMIEVSNENDDYNIWGYISYPELTKSNRTAITTLVNGRVIKNNDINRLIVDTYHTYIPKDKFPYIVLNINVDPILIDINIHPTKMDIKFSKEDELKQLIEKTIKEKLETLLLIPKARIIDEEPLLIKKEVIETKEEDNTEEEYEELTLDFEVREGQNEEQIETEGPRIKKMIPRGIVYLTYIIAENSDGMYLIDQHAAGERINYEKVLKELSQLDKRKKDLLVPIKIELTSSEVLMLKGNLHLLEDIGIHLEDFGQNTYIIRSQPLWLPSQKEEEAIRKIIDLVITNEKFDTEKFHHKTASTISCKLSVKANDYVDESEMQYLIDTLSMCDNPFTCPHGRPTIITYTKYDLEKMFKRALD